MTPPLQAYEQYRATHGPEWLLRIGDPAAPRILIIPPLFEEMNRTRALMVAAMRALAGLGLCSYLPDLSGTGESLAGLETVGWRDWEADVALAAEHITLSTAEAPLIASLRGGCLLDHAAPGLTHWRFAPVAGASLARDLDRAALGGGAEWGGYHHAAPDLRDALKAATPGEPDRVRTVRLGTDAAAADLKVGGPALWRRSEPGQSLELADRLADDIAYWRQVCVGS